MEDTLRLFPAARLGRLWFQYRSLSPVPFFLLMLVLPPEHVPAGWTLWVPVAVALVSEGLRVVAVGYAGSSTRTRGDSVPALVHAGPYRYVRNPLYLANIGLYTSFAVLLGFSKLAAVFFLYSCLQYALIVRFEESILQNTFGSAYRAYLQQVPRWIPAAPRIEASRHEFDLRRALRSERSTLIAMCVAVALVLIRYSIIDRVAP